MSKRTDIDLLQDILESIRRIDEYTSGADSLLFFEDTKTQDSVIRNIEIIGEASRQVSDDVKAQSPTIAWRQMTGMRNRLIHDYSGINLDIVWSVICDDLPSLGVEIQHLFIRLSKEHAE